MYDFYHPQTRHGPPHSTHQTPLLRLHEDEPSARVPRPTLWTECFKIQYWPLGRDTPVAASCRWHDRVPRPRGLRGTRPPQWSRSCQSYPQARWTNPKMDTDTHTLECMHHTPRIPSSRACYTGASNMPSWVNTEAHLFTSPTLLAHLMRLVRSRSSWQLINGNARVLRRRLPTREVYPPPPASCGHGKPARPPQTRATHQTTTTPLHTPRAGLRVPLSALERLRSRLWSGSSLGCRGGAR